MIRTWHAEMAVAAIVLGTVAFVGDGSPIEFVGAGAVLLSFGHAQVADRLAEAEADRQSCVRDEGSQRRSVHCHRWATRYLVGKEVLWLLYFVVHHSWSALAGVGLFLVYPSWRRFWRARQPLSAA